MVSLAEESKKENENREQLQLRRKGRLSEKSCVTDAKRLFKGALLARCSAQSLPL